MFIRNGIGRLIAEAKFWLRRPKLDEERRYVLRCNDDQHVAFRASDQIGRRILINGFFEPEVSAALAVLVPLGGTAIDIGANVGVHTVAMGRLAGPSGRVIAFEPNVAVRIELERNIRLNSLGNVTVADVAVSSVCGETSFEFPAVGREAFGGMRRTKLMGSSRSSAVQVTTLDEYVLREGLNRVDVCKIDTEGAELEVLRGAIATLQRHRPVIVFEAADMLSASYAYRREDVFAFLAAERYLIRPIGDGNFVGLPM